MSLIATQLACGPGAGTPAGAVLDDIAEQYVRAALQLALHDPALVSDWHGPESWRPAIRIPVAEIAASVDGVAAALAETGASRSERNELNRARYLRGQVRALGLAARRLRGTATSFDEDARDGLGLAIGEMDGSEVARARATLEMELPGPGPLADRVAAFRTGFRVPGGLRDLVMRAAVNACRTASAAAIDWPRDETVELTFVPALPWDAFARRSGPRATRIEINGAEPLDLTRALRLACHEAYPGHHVQHLWADELATGRGWSEFLLEPGFGPHVLVAEGAAEAGADLAMPPERRLQVYRDVLAPAAGIPAGQLERLVRVEAILAAVEPAIAAIARDYLDNRINGQTAIARLSAEALVASPETMVAFIERRRARVLVYPLGRRLVLEELRQDGLGGLRRLFVEQVWGLHLRLP
jgi:hypothetical protein